MEPQLIHTDDNLVDGIAQLAYSNFDTSHDINHARKVASNCRWICEHEDFQLTPSQVKLIVWLAYLHDAIDHKYEHVSISQSELRQIFIDHFDEDTATNAIILFENISWSKRSTSIKMKDMWRTYQMIVQDADWLEALGKTGIERCQTYQSTLGKGTRDVVMHIYEKLLHVPEHLNTKTAREVAKSLILPLTDYVELHDRDGKIKSEYEQLKSRATVSNMQARYAI